jgi:putative transposase
VLCRVLGVSRSGYYSWAQRLTGPAVGRAAEDQELLAEIRDIHRDFAYYGAPRVHRELLARSRQVGRHRVARLMRLHGIAARRGKIKSRPRAAPPVRRPEIADRVRRDFTADGPNRLWFTDITMIRTGEGFLYAAVILDAFNREVISWAVEDRDSPKTVLRAFVEAIKSRRPKPHCVIHSDRGYQFTSHDWVDLAKAHRIEVSIGERKSALDNAVMESWFASLKNEDIYPNGMPATRNEARQRLFAYIWAYNNRRLHSTLGYQTPAHYKTINQ